MKKKALIKSFLCLSILALWIPIQAQQVDPFYLKLMEQGQKSLFEERYQDAIEELRVAVFGLGTDKALKGKAYVYMGLAYYYLKNLDECENHLRQAESHLGKEGFDNLEIDEASRRQLEEILEYFQIGGRKSEIIAGLPEAPARREPQPKVPQAPPITPQAEDKIEQPARDPIGQLEQKIKSAPKNTSAYYELYNIYRGKKDTVKARKTLEKLVKANPTELHAFFMLGLIHYETRKYNDAIKNFTKISQLAASVEIEEELRDKAQAYLILSTYLKGDREKAVELASQSGGQLTEEKIDAISLKTDERARLLNVISQGKNAAEARRLESRINSLKARIKSRPQDVELYYELYQIYREINNAKEAKDTAKNLVKKNPAEMQGQILLAKLEFRDRRYRDVLKSCQRILEAPDTARVERELMLKALVYAAIASDRLDKEKDKQRYLQHLQLRLNPDELNTILQEEGLTDEWNKMVSETSGDFTHSGL